MYGEPGQCGLGTATTRVNPGGATSRDIGVGLEEIDQRPDRVRRRGGVGVHEDEVLGVAVPGTEVCGRRIAEIASRVDVSRIRIARKQVTEVLDVDGVVDDGDRNAGAEVGEKGGQHRLPPVDDHDDFQARRLSLPIHAPSHRRCSPDVFARPSLPPYRQRTTMAHRGALRLYRHDA